MADFSKVTADDCKTRKMPANCRANASHTFVLQSVINEIKAHGRSSMRHEVCGVLLGNLCFDGEPYLFIDARIEGKYASHQSGSVTFTSETWDYINSERDAKFPDRKIVGWYHTHPGFGIFLSNMDVFIHQNFFPMPWQPAYVFDPQAETDGFFFACGDSLEQEDVVVVPDEAPSVVVASKAPKFEQAMVLTDTAEAQLESRRFAIVTLSASLLLLVIVNVFGFFIFRDMLAESGREVESRTKQVREADAREAALAEKCESLAGESKAFAAKCEVLTGEVESLRLRVSQLVAQGKEALEAAEKRLKSAVAQEEAKWRQAMKEADEKARAAEDQARAASAKASSPEKVDSLTPKVEAPKLAPSSQEVPTQPWYRSVVRIIFFWE